jgi:cyclophilin family peptidyl-prolyl cis-trans isomerase
MKRVTILSLALLAVCSLTLSGCKKPEDSQQVNSQPADQALFQSTNLAASQAPQPEKTMKTIADFEPIEATQVTLGTTKGELVIELFREQAPLTTANFLNLVNSHFYDGIVFHRVIADFMAQVGDPLTKDPTKQAMWGSGGPGYAIADEFDPKLKHDAKGIVSMANSGPNTGGSQFFITYAPTPWLDNKHAVFGKVISGMDVVDKLEIGDKILSSQLK